MSSAAALQDENLMRVIREFGYTLMNPIGTGGTASCFLVFSEKYNMYFVVKKMEISNKVICTHCELNALRTIISPHVIQMYNFKVEQDSIYLVLEYCSQGSLLDFIKKDGRLKGDKLNAICYTLLLGLKDIHDHAFAHLDIKPANILVDRYGRIKLADFGISRQQTDEKKEGQRAGTVVFMAPEIWNKKSYDPFKADIWSMGITFYFLATGKVPWRKTADKDATIKQIKSGYITYPSILPASFQGLLRKMLTVNPENRENIDELLKSPIFSNVKKDDCLMGKVSEVPPDEGQLRCLKEMELNAHSENFVCQIPKKASQPQVPQVASIKSMSSMKKFSNLVFANKPGNRRSKLGNNEFKNNNSFL